MSIYGVMVTRNEADRYLAKSVAWLRSITDGVLVFDDQSDDDTATIATDAGAFVAVRLDETPSFLENESKFREQAWRELSSIVTTDDWVLSMDADEFLVSRIGPERDSLEAAIKYADDEGADSIEFQVAEIFDMVGPRPMARTDGEWAKIRAARMCRWQNPPVFTNTALAGGSLPRISNPVLRVGDPCILHAGYLRPEDRRTKYNRYTEHKGHGGAHVQSILKTGIYEPWSTPVPEAIAEALQ